jgi:ribosomal protein S24E
MGAGGTVMTVRIYNIEKAMMKVEFIRIINRNTLSFDFISLVTEFMILVLLGHDGEI